MARSGDVLCNWEIMCFLPLAISHGKYVADIEENIKNYNFRMVGRNKVKSVTVTCCMLVSRISLVCATVSYHCS